MTDAQLVDFQKNLWPQGGVGFCVQLATPHAGETVRFDAHEHRRHKCSAFQRCKLARHDSDKLEALDSTMKAPARSMRPQQAHATQQRSLPLRVVRPGPALPQQRVPLAPSHAVATTTNPLTRVALDKAQPSRYEFGTPSSSLRSRVCSLPLPQGEGTAVSALHQRCMGLPVAKTVMTALTFHCLGFPVLESAC